MTLLVLLSANLVRFTQRCLGVVVSHHGVENAGLALFGQKSEKRLVEGLLLAGRSEP